MGYDFAVDTGWLRLVASGEAVGELLAGDRIPIRASDEIKIAATVNCLAAPCRLRPYRDHLAHLGSVGKFLRDEPQRL